MNSIASILRSLVMLVTLGLVIAMGVVGYRTYQDIKAGFDRIDRYLSDMDSVIGKHDGILDRLDKTIRKFKIGDAVPPPIPIADTYDKPTVILYSIEGCGPCEQWWREQAPQWILAGWRLQRKTSKNNRPTPYWDVYDGTKWMSFDKALTYEVYKKAGGR